MIFPPNTFFAKYILIEVLCGHDFFTDTKNKVKRTPPDTLNIVVKLTKNFLEALEKKVSAQNMRF